MQMTISSTITITNPTLAIQSYCKSQLEIPNPEYAKKMRMGFWTGNTPKMLYLYETRGDSVVIPYGCLKDIVSMIPHGTMVERDFTPPQCVDYGQPTGLYPYQEKAVEEAYRGNYGIIQSPCGSGKTEMAIALVKKWGRKTLFLAHTLDIIKQARDRAILRGIDKSLIGTIAEGKVNIGKGITFATVQTLSALDLRKYEDEWDVVITDECHHLSGSPTALTMYYKVLSNLKARHKYGLSATVHRSDGLEKGIFALTGDVVWKVPREEIKTMQVGVRPIGTGIKIDRKCLNTDGTLNYTKLISYLTETDVRNACINQYIIENSDKSCLILSDRLDHLSFLIRILPTGMRENAVMISGKMTSKKGKAEREQALEDMRTGKKKYLFATYSLAKEALDIPRLERLFLATPQKDYAVITQAIGRIAREFQGKAKPVCYDFVDDIGYLVKSYKKRCSIYKKNGCYFVED